VRLINAPLSRSGPVHKKILQDERTVAARERAAATETRQFAVFNSRVRFELNDAILG
jgi:hypothetical protein